MADLETLSIKIKADATTAYKAINNLANSLGNLSVSIAKIETSKLNDLAGSLVNLNYAIQTANATARATDYNKITGNFIKLATVDTARLNGLASTLQNLSSAFANMTFASTSTTSIRDLASAISKLGGVQIEKAITNIPRLEQSLSHLITTFSKLPNINQSIIDFVNSLANLSSQGQRVGSAVHTIDNALDRFSATATRATRRSHSLASTIGTLYAKFWLFMRGARALKSAFVSAADYLEAFNYFDVVAKKIGKDTFAKAGVGSAEEYADAFTATMQEKLKKMSGLQLDLEDRLIKTTNAKSLGLNLTELTQYQASIASITNAMGVSQGVAESTAKAFSMLAGDMSSLRNMDFDEVARKLQSGLAGQARALYAFGIDITNATLEQYAYANGISKSVSEMTQAEKAQLRLLAILDQSKVSWGDLANTINSPSNQLRMLKNNLKEVGTVFGQLFIPMMQSVLPVLNGLSMAIKQLMIDIAELLGIQLDLDSFGTFGQEIDEDVEGMEELNQAVKDTKKSIRDFDELKVISSGKDSGSGMGDQIDLTQEIIDATAEYEKVWEEAYNRMTSKASEIAGYISSAFEPIKKIIEDFHIGDFFKAGEDVSALVASIFNFVSDAIDDVDWLALGQKIGDFLAGINWTEILKSIGGLIGSAIQAALNLWVGSFSVAPFETAILTAFALLKFTGLGSVLTGTIGNALSGVLSSQRFTKEILQKTGLGLISMGVGIALTVDNIQSMKAGKTAVNDVTFWVKSVVSSIFTGAGFALAASAIGIMSGGLAFAIGAAITLTANLVLGVINTPTGYDQLKKITDAEYDWVTQNNLDRMEIKTDIDLRGAITQESIDNIDDLAAKVWDMSQNYDNLTSAQKGWLKEYSDQLVQAVPSIESSIDRITGAYKGTYDQLQDLIDKEKEQIMLESYRQNVSDVSSALSNAEYDKRKLEKDLENNPKVREVLRQKVEDALGEDYNAFLFQDMVDYITDAESWTKKHSTSAAGIKRWYSVQSAITKLDDKGGLANLQAYVKALAQEETIREQISETENTIADLTKEQEYWLGKMGESFETTFGNIEETVSDNIDSTVTEIKRDKLPKAMKDTLDKVDDKIEKGGKVSKDDMTSLFNSINNSFAGLDNGKVPREVQNTMSAIENAILTNSPKLVHYMEQLRAQMEDAFANAAFDKEGNLIYNPKNIVGRMDDTIANIQKAVANGAPLTGMEKPLENQLTELFGEKLPNNVSKSFEALKDAIKHGYGVNEAIKDLQKKVADESDKLGWNVVFGIAGGIFDGTKIVAGVVERMAKVGINQTFTDTEQINSPSKVMEDLAEYIPEGTALGIKKGIPDVKLAMTAMTNAINSAFGDYRYNVPSLDYGMSGSGNRYNYSSMDAENAFMSQMMRMVDNGMNRGQNEVVFRIEGDPHGMFKIIREQNDSYKKKTHKSAFI